MLCYIILYYTINVFDWFALHSIASHHITSHQITSHQITSYLIISYYIEFDCICHIYVCVCMCVCVCIYSNNFNTTQHNTRILRIQINIFLLLSP